MRQDDDYAREPQDHMPLPILIAGDTSTCYSEAPSNDDELSTQRTDVEAFNSGYQNWTFADDEEWAALFLNAGFNIDGEYSCRIKFKSRLQNERPGILDQPRKKISGRAALCYLPTWLELVHSALCHKVTCAQSEAVHKVEWTTRLMSLCN